MEINTVLNELVQSLKSSDPYKIILFGSYAQGTATENSDIDLVVILDNNDIARTFKERSNKKLYINRLVREINYEIALDILVYSKEEYKIAKDYGNYLLDEIERTGKILYEKAKRN
jgi:predicted nucleotidyltransferase